MTKREELVQKVIAVLSRSEGLAERSCMDDVMCTDGPCSCADGIVDALLAALSEPSEVMVNAAEQAVLRQGMGDFFDDDTCATISAALSHTEIVRTWQAMLRAIKDE